VSTPIFGVWPPPFTTGGATAIGAPVAGGIAPAVLFVDSAGKLAQDPAPFGYNPITHTLIRAAPAAPPDAEFTFESWIPADGAAPRYTKALGGARFTGVWDPAYKEGFNQDGSIVGIGQIATNTEGRFQYAPGAFAQEWFVRHTKRNGGTTLRMLGLFADEAPGGPRNLGLAGDTIAFLNGLAVQIGGTDLAGNINVIGGGAFVQNTNNVPAISQIDPTLSTFRELIKLDNTDRGQLFRLINNWQSAGANPGAEWAGGIVNNTDGTLEAMARLVLAPTGWFPPSLNRLAYIEGYNPAGTVNSGLRIATYNGASHVVADFTKDGYLRLVSAAGKVGTFIPYSGDPNGVVTAPKGSIATNDAGSGVANRLWINQNGGTVWAAVTTTA
jgi:hypothetical protein